MKLLNLPEKPNREGKPRLPLHVYFSYLLVLTMAFTGVSFSKYATSAEASASARVAAFRMETTGEAEASFTLDLTDSDTANDSGSYAFTVTSNSEVAVKDQVTVTLPKTLPAGVTMNVKVGTETVTPTVTGNDYVYSKDFAPGSFSHDWTLTFTADPEKVTEEIMLEDITVTVDAEQID